MGGTESVGFSVHVRIHYLHKKDDCQLEKVQDKKHWQETAQVCSIYQQPTNF